MMIDKKPEQIARQIVSLVEELASLAGNKLILQSPSRETKVVKSSKATKGATGGLRVLIADGYFDEPRQLAHVRERLRKDGRHYGRSTISMGLLSLVRERVLIRIKEGDSNNWQYVIRR